MSNIQIKLPPNFNKCSTCLNKQCAVASMQTSSELTALGNSSAFNKGALELPFTVLSWEGAMS